MINDLKPFMMADPRFAGGAAPAPALVPMPAPARTTAPRKEKPNKQLTNDPLIQCLAELHEPTFAELTKHGQNRPKNADALLKLEWIPALRAPENKTRLWSRDTRFSTLIATESDLTKTAPISLATFLTLCRMFDVAPFLVIYKNTYFVFGHDPTDTTAAYPKQTVIWCPNTRKWQYTTTAPHNLPPYRIEKFNKPYKAVSSYKIAELRELCGILEICCTPAAEPAGTTKPELYGKLKAYFSDWLPTVSS